MRKSSFFCLLFFIVVQSAIVFYLRKFHSFADSKGFLVASEGLLVMATASWYLLSRPAERPRERARPPQTTLPPPPKSDDRELLIKTLTNEKQSLSEEMRQLTESALFSKKRLEDIEREHNEIQRRLSEAEGANVEAQKTIDSCRSTIQSLTTEIDRLMIQIDQERRAHSIEVRAFLSKTDGATDTDLGKKKKSRQAAAVPKMATPPLPSLLLLLATCQKGLDLLIAPDWPASEHRLLVRRKFFDVAKKMNSTPFAVVSLENPTEYFLSPKLPSSLTISDVQAATASYKASFSRLQQFEPYHFTDERLGGRWVAFRTAWNNLEDLIAMAPLTLS